MSKNERIQYFTLLLTSLYLSACFEATPTRQTNFVQQVGIMNCKELGEELAYQKKVLINQADPTRQSDAGAIATTMLTLGYNHVSHASQDSDRDDHSREIGNKIALITSNQRSKVCP